MVCPIWGVSPSSVFMRPFRAHEYQCKSLNRSPDPFGWESDDGPVYRASDKDDYHGVMRRYDLSLVVPAS